MAMRCTQWSGPEAIVLVLVESLHKISKKVKKGL